MTIRPDLDHLETFLAVVDARGFARAAERLGVSQPAVSYRVSRLEDQLGTPLLEEPRRRIILTPAGVALRDFCRRLFPDLDTLVDGIVEGTAAPPPLRIACPGTFGRNVVFPALQDGVLQTMPVELLFRSLDDIFDLVESGTVDLGIAYGTRVTNSLEFIEIAEEEFVLIAPPGGSPTPDASVAQIADRPFVTYEECDYVFGKYFQDVFGHRPARMNTSSAFSRLEEVVESVAGGGGCSIVPVHSIRPAHRERGVEVYRPIGRPRSLNPEYAVTRPGWQSRAEVPALLADIGRRARLTYLEAPTPTATRSP